MQLVRVWLEEREGGGVKRTGAVPLNGDKDRNRKSCGIECVESTLQ